MKKSQSMFSSLKKISNASSVFTGKISRLLLALILLTFPTSDSRAELLKLPTVTVLADKSLSLAVTEITRNYSRDRQIITNSSFASKQSRQTQISEGAAADILITADEPWIEELKQQGLIDIHSQIKLASDRLVLIGSADTQVTGAGLGNFPTSAIIGASGGEPSLFLGNPEFMQEGRYAKEALRSYGVSGDLEPYTLYVKDLNQMLDGVIKQNMFAICFAGSVHLRSDVKIIDKIPESSHKPIDYYAVVIAGDNMEEGRKFIDYLKTEKNKNIFAKYGFIAD